ncbi:hypothetical protein AU194_28190 [Mycobacterium sp. GA-2829]|nr:hypothetical protein AU194_28190 [Mycobacterium sp. GA-2829]
MTTPPVLGRLEVIEPRTVWNHEAHSFTPWLLHNVDVLSDLLGMDLELHVAEHPVGDFYLDLYGRDVADDGVVIVENQLERSDHSHLGQILTYAAGTDPRTIVWITTGFRAEHRAALDWLNEHTDPDTRFFGIEIEVVKIGASAPAPNFKLVVSPNDWSKQVKAAADASSYTGLPRAYWDFWRQFLDRIAAEHPTWTQAKASTNLSWYNLSTGTSGISLATAFRRDTGLTVLLEFDSSDASRNEERFMALKSKQADFERALGAPAEWDERPGAKSCAVFVSSDFTSVLDEGQWTAMQDWLLDKHSRFRDAVAVARSLGVIG